MQEASVGVSNGRGLKAWCGELETSLCYSVGTIHNGINSLGDWCVRGTPGPIPNPEVKPDSADGTWRETARESRSSPRGLCLAQQGLASASRNRSTYVERFLLNQVVRVVVWVDNKLNSLLGRRDGTFTVLDNRSRV